MPIYAVKRKGEKKKTLCLIVAPRLEAAAARAKNLERDGLTAKLGCEPGGYSVVPATAKQERIWRREWWDKAYPFLADGRLLIPSDPNVDTDLWLCFTPKEIQHGRALDLYDLYDFGEAASSEPKT